MTVLIDPDLDFASYYQDGDPDRSCERLYLWHQALCSHRVDGVGPIETEISYDWANGLRLTTADGATFRLGSDGIIPTWSTPGWTKRFSPELVAEIGLDTDDFFRIASTIGGTSSSLETATARAGRR